MIEIDGDRVIANIQCKDKKWIICDLGVLKSIKMEKVPKTGRGTIIIKYLDEYALYLAKERKILEERLKK